MTLVLSGIALWCVLSVGATLVASMVIGRMKGHQPRPVHVTVPAQRHAVAPRTVVLPR